MTRTFDLMNADGTRRKRFTLDRETATSGDNVDLIGLDHPIIQEELGHWRSLCPNHGRRAGRRWLRAGNASLWMVEAYNSAGEKRTTIQTIAVNKDGTRIPALERQLDEFMKAAPQAAIFTPEQQLGDVRRVCRTDTSA